MKKQSNLWRFFVNLWSFVTFFIIIVDFIYNNRYEDIVGPVLAVYTASLAIYSADKEFERWHHYHEGRHPGELYVIIWTVGLLALLAADAILLKPYKVEPEIVATYIVVLGILAVTRKSKTLFRQERARK